jgi:hypothetical protein
MSTHIHQTRRISAKINTALLAEFLNRKLGYRQMFCKASPSSNTGMRAGVLPDGMVLGFIPNVDYPSDILVVPTPLSDTMVPTAAISNRDGAWQISPQIVKVDRLFEYAVIEIEKTAWLSAVTTLVTDFRVRRDWRGIDEAAWMIVAAWPNWEAAALSWEERAADLARRLGINPLSPNTLLRKCERMGLHRK